MRISEIELLEDEAPERVEDLLEGRVFHVARYELLEQIQKDGVLRSNADGSLQTTFGSSSSSYFRKRGCLSLFDYREPPNDTIRDFRSRCAPLQPARVGGPGVAIFMLRPAVFSQLIPWTQWKMDQACGDMIVPYVEAGFPGSIPIEQIEEVIVVRVLLNPNANSLAARLRRARARQSKP
jgi:hypothetical protein